MQKSPIRVSVGVVAGVALVVALTIPGYAHHGWGGNSNQESEMTGTVEELVSLAGPHATMKVRVDGQVWDITLGPPARTSRAGLREGIIPKGATVTLVGHKNMTPNRLEMKTEKVTWNNQVFDVYPDRH